MNKIEYSDSEEFQATALQEYVLNGTSYGQYKTVSNLNYWRVYAAGHEVPYYRKLEVSQCENPYADEDAHTEPEASLHAFKQIMQGLPLNSQ